MDGVGAAVSATVLVSLAVGLPVTVRAVRRFAPVARPASPRGAGPLTWPGFWLCMVFAAVYLNQVLFTIYVIRVHDGEVPFVADYLPTGWFSLASDNRLIAALADAWPAPGLLAPSLLRIPALLELPLVVLAFLCVCRWWDRRLYQSLASGPVLVTACAGYTVTFGLIEWSLRNPYTWQDLGLRVAAGMLTPVAVGWLARRSGVADRAGTATRPLADLLIFAGSAGVTGYLVLVVYDTALLYNLGHLADHLPAVPLAVGMLAAARFAARRRRRRAPPRPGPGIATVNASLGWFICLFFIPALPIRYAVGFAPAPVAIAAAVTVVATTAVLAARDVHAGLRPPRRRTVLVWVGQCTAAVLAGTLAATAALPVRTAYPETRLLLAAALFLSAAVLTSALTDRLTHHGGRLAIPEELRHDPPPHLGRGPARLR